MDAVVIAPFWDDSVDGRIYYRVSREPHLDDEISSVISDAFDVDFRATVAFVATWANVTQEMGLSSGVSNTSIIKTINRNNYSYRAALGVKVSCCFWLCTGCLAESGHL